MPAMLSGHILIPMTRTKQRLCVQYQHGEDKCKARFWVTQKKSGCILECADGARQCAGVIRSGRTCFLLHPGSECGRAVCKVPSASAKGTRPALPVASG
eukprot:8439310-Karenia_brevis.AAC.1